MKYLHPHVGSKHDLKEYKAYKVEWQNRIPVDEQMYLMKIQLNKLDHFHLKYLNLLEKKSLRHLEAEGCHL